MQERRAGSWGGGARPDEPGLMDYEQLYALWERQNWRAHELDFSEDREQWASSPSEAQENMTWSLGSFYIGEGRVTAGLAPFRRARRITRPEVASQGLDLELDFPDVAFEGAAGQEPQAQNEGATDDADCHRHW